MPFLLFVLYDISVTHRADRLRNTGIACRILQPRLSLYVQVQFRGIYRPCGVQIYTVLHHTLEKKGFDSWFLAQLDGSYLFSDSGLCFSKPKQ